MVTLADVNPLTEQHYKDIVEALEGVAITRKQLALAKAAGLNMSAEEEQLNATEATLRKIRQVYFPGR